MRRLKLGPVLAVLAVVLVGCIPGLGTMEPVAVRMETPHIAVATFTPTVAVTDVILSFAGGNIDLVRSEDVRFQCQPYRSGWDCYAVGQDNPAAPRLVHQAGEPMNFIVYASDASRVV